MIIDGKLRELFGWGNMGGFGRARAGYVGGGHTILNDPPGRGVGEASEVDKIRV